MPPVGVIEARLISEFEEETGIQLPRLAKIEGLQGVERDSALVSAEKMIDHGQDLDFRSILYRVFVQPGASKSLNRLLEWYTTESDEMILQTLECAITNNSSALDALKVITLFLQKPSKLRHPSICWMLEKARSNKELLEQLRSAYIDCLYDLEILSYIASTAPNRYDLLSGCKDAGSDRLNAKQVIGLLDFQVPHREKPFRRPKLVPFYGRILEWLQTSGNEIEKDLASFARTYSVDVISDVKHSLNVLGIKQPIVLGIHEQPDLQRVVGIISIPSLGENQTYRTSHRKKGSVRRSESTVAGYLIGALAVPIAEEWNLYPKHLLSLEFQERLASVYRSMDNERR